MNTNTEYSKTYRNTKRGHMATLLSRARRRAKEDNLAFDIDLDYVMSLPSDTCQIFGLELTWCAGSKIRTEDSPSLDKINPALGYVKGNVAWVSWRANRIKNDGDALEHEQIAQWIRTKVVHNSDLS
jgi:hypothetical protein